MPARGQREPIVGRRFGRLVCLIDDDHGKGRKGLFRCDCGTQKLICVQQVRCGRTSSCGCIHRERTSARLTKHGHAKVGGRTTEYRIWYAMKDRTLNPECDAYQNYGGRGITICDRWRDSFEAFLEDMGPRPSGLTIDRIDNDRGYEPGNCRWATYTRQANNRRSNRLVKVDGKEQTLAEACRSRGLKLSTVWSRLKRGATVSEALSH